GEAREMANTAKVLVVGQASPSRSESGNQPGSGLLDHDRELVFMRLYRVRTWQGNHLRWPFQFDDDLVGPLRGAACVFRLDVSRERKAAVLVDVAQRFDMRIGRRLELNPAVRH